MKLKKSKQKFALLFFCLACVAFFCTFVLCSIPFAKLAIFDGNTFVTAEEMQSIESPNFFGRFVRAKIKNDCAVDVATWSAEDVAPEVEFKLFNLIPIKTRRIKILKNDKVLVSGSAVGLVLKTDGVLVVGSSVVNTPQGEFDALTSTDLKIGDVIMQIEDQTIFDVASISKIINEEKNKDRELDVVVKRNKTTCHTKVRPCYDINSQNYKLGVWVRDDASGIGTLTYIDQNNRFGALGHPICDSDTKSVVDLKFGKIFNCSVLGINKGLPGKPGEIKGLFVQNKNEQGIVEKNNEYGVFGSINSQNSISKKAVEMDIGGRLSVKPGPAKIRCCIEGESVEEFDIEIIKTNFQNFSNDKSMVIRVADDRLLQKTGGIVQGMSGSPIIQNGKIVGAVTHVFVSDPSKGFGVYIDWMLSQ